MVRSEYGVMPGTADLVPKPIGRLPMLVTGSSRQSLEWIAEHADGWITYPRSLEQQAALAARWRAAVAATTPGVFKPFAQSFYIDLTDDPNRPPVPIHFGFRGGRNIVFHFLGQLRAAGIHHVILNFKYGARSAAAMLEEIGQEIVPRLEASQPVSPTASRAA